MDREDGVRLRGKTMDKFMNKGTHPLSSEALRP